MTEFNGNEESLNEIMQPELRSLITLVHSWRYMKWQ